MNFIATQSDLNYSLQALLRFTTAKSQLPLLNNIYLKTQKDSLLLVATNLELTLSLSIPAKINSPGEITLPSSQLAELVATLPSEKIEFELTSTGLIKLITLKHQTELTTMPTTDYPLPTLVTNPQTITLKSSTLQEIFSQTGFASSQDDTRPILTAISLDLVNQSYVATDGFRLSYVTTDTKITKSQQDLPILLIPNKAISEVLKLIKENQDINLQIDPDTKQINFILQNQTILSTRLLTGEYPDYNRIIPKSYQTTITISTKEFVQSIKTAQVFARDSANVVRFKIGTGSILITSNAPQLGKNQTEVEAKIEGKPLETAFNCKFLLDFLAITTSPTIVFKCNESLTPVVFTDPTKPNFMHIIMPVKLQD